MGHDGWREVDVVEGPIVPVESDAPRHEDQRVIGPPMRLGHALPHPQPPRREVIERSRHKGIPAEFAEHEVPGLATEDTPDEQVVDVLGVLRA
jgi:hypothetical protein